MLHRPECVPVGLHSLIRIFASLRCAARGANPYATDRFRAAAEPTGKKSRNNGPILRWDQLSFWRFMLDRVKLCTLEIFGDSVATASFLRCKFRSFSPRFSSVIRSPSLVFFGDYFRCQMQSVYFAMESFILRPIVRLSNFR